MIWWKSWIICFSYWWTVWISAPTKQHREKHTLVTHVRGRAYRPTQLPYGHKNIHGIWLQITAEGKDESYLPRCSQGSQDHFHMSYAVPESLRHTELCSAPMDPSLSKTHEGGTTNAHCSTCEKRQTRRQKIYLVPRQDLPQKSLFALFR